MVWHGEHKRLLADCIETATVPMCYVPKNVAYALAETSSWDHARGDKHPHNPKIGQL